MLQQMFSIYEQENFIVKDNFICYNVILMELLN